MNTNKNISRLLGAAFLFVAAASLISGVLLTSLGIPTVGSPNNIAEVLIEISENATTMRVSVVVMLIEAMAIVLLATLLFTTLKNQIEVAARWALGLWIIEAVALAFRSISAFSLLTVSLEFVEAGAPDPSHFQTLGSLFFGTTQFSISVLMVFYCTGGILFYYLFYKSNYVPKALSLFGLAAASLGLVGTLLEIMGYAVPLVVFLPILPFELAIGIWLIVKGFNPSAIEAESAAKRRSNQIPTAV